MVIADCTIGTGGHAEEILKIIGKTGYLIGIDRDKEALRLAQQRLQTVSDNFRLFHTNYTQVGSVLHELHLQRLDGAIFDLGVSSLQLDTASRGFSIQHNGALDMRMDQDDTVTASDIVNRYSKQELEALFKEFGDERFARRIAERIVRERERERITTTGRLGEVVQDALPYRYRFKKIHPATRVFMALRIAVNNEIDNLCEGLNTTIPLLGIGARACIITFHSIEDRIVKNTFKEYSRRSELKILTKKPIRPSEEEVRNNPRSRSAKLRVAERRMPPQRD